MHDKLFSVQRPLHDAGKVLMNEASHYNNTTELTSQVLYLFNAQKIMSVLFYSYKIST